MTDTNQTKTATTPTKEQVVGKDGAGARLECVKTDHRRCESKRSIQSQ